MRMSNNRKNLDGFALVAVLIIVVVVTILVVVFMNSSRFNFTASSLFSKSVHAEQVTLSGGEELVSLLSREAKLGASLSTTNSPIGIMPVRYGVSEADPRKSRLVRRSLGNQSTYNQAFTQAGFSAPPANLASPISTATKPRNGRSVVETRWQLPGLLQSAESFSAPDWIYLTRSGAKDVSTLSIASLSDLSDPSNENAIVGRFAYMVYDISGLLDLRIAGFSPGNLASFSEKGTSASTDIVSYLGKFGASSPAELLAWRSPDATTEIQEVYGIDPVPAGGDQLGLVDSGTLAMKGTRDTFLSRRDLLQFSAQYPNRIPEEALPFIRTFSAAFEAPEIPEAIPGTKLLSASADVTVPAFNMDGESKPYKIKAGEPLFQRRFPLSRLRWFARRAEGGSPEPNLMAAIKQHFGLTWFADLAAAGIGTPEFQGVSGWVYTSPSGNAPATSIKTLSQVAALQREPDFFEWLKAGVGEGSLGASLGSNNSSVNDAQDKSKDFQIIQIGANIVDHSDYDDVPTLIASATARQRDNSPLVAFGVENLPYLNELIVSFRYDQSNPTLLNSWYQFELWNPNKNAASLKVTADGIPITKVRARVVEGENLLEPYFRVNRGSTTSLIAQLVALASQRRTSIPRSFSGNEATDSCEIDIGIESFGEPKVAGDSATTTSGVYKNAASPGRNFRAGPSPTESGFKGILAGSATAPNPIWPRDTRLDATGITDTTVVDNAAPYFGSMTKPCGVKYWNAARLKNVPLDYNSPPSANPASITLVMEVEVDGKWVPYQSLEAINNTSGVLEYPGRDINHYGPGGGSKKLSFEQFFNSAWTAPPTGSIDPYPGVTSSGDLESRLFYGWNGFCYRSGMAKIDPRTRRMSVFATAAASPGASIRDTQDNWDSNTNNRLSNWDVVLLSSTQVPIAGYAENLSSSPARYADSDGTIRPSDFARLDSSDFPGISGRGAARPEILNRPFRSVAELGLVFRDEPWKSLDFFSKQSADLSLFDIFSTVDGPVSTGKVNPNSADVETLAVVIKGADMDPRDTSAGTITDAQAMQAAQSIFDAIESASNTYLPSLGAVTRVLRDNSPGSTIKNKIQGEAFQRAVSGSLDTRTWNFLLDVIGQSGRLVPSASGLNDFSVTGESRLWMLVAIDRYTGKVIAQKVEWIYE